MAAAILARFGRCRSGAAILEFAIVLPILLLLVAGAVELGRATFVRLVMQNAVQSGARSLARVPDPECRPGCTPGAARAVEATTAQIADRTGIAPAAIRVVPRADPPAGTIVLTAETRMTAAIFDGIGLPIGWMLSVSHQEARLAP